MAENSIPESFWCLASASVVKDKAAWAMRQTSELGRTKTIISVDADEAQAIYLAMGEYIAKHREEYGI